MLKQILIVSMLCSGLIANAQLGKLLKKAENSANGVPSEDLPKGVEIYSATHTDSMGFSGKYYAKYPIKLSFLNAMNMPKYFNLSELTIELRQKSLTGVVHYINDEPGKQLRRKNTDMNTVIDLRLPGVNGNEMPRRNMKACNCFQLEVENNVSGIGLKDGARFYRYTKDPDIIFVGDPNMNEYGKGRPSFFTDNSSGAGGNFNMFSKNKEKLAEWDSVKIAAAIFEMEGLYLSTYTSSFASMVELPKKGVSDAAREKEYFNLIMPFATKDKPVAWGDKFQFCYIQKDWKVFYKKDNPTAISHRSATVIAVSTGWPRGECRYITCAINQPYDGKEFGKAFMAGFVGSLVPVSCESVAGFK